MPSRVLRFWSQVVSRVFILCSDACLVCSFALTAANKHVFVLVPARLGNVLSPFHLGDNFFGFSLSLLGGKFRSVNIVLGSPSLGGKYRLVNAVLGLIHTAKCDANMFIFLLQQCKKKRNLKKKCWCFL